jgi:hypothetical protein
LLPLGRVPTYLPRSLSSTVIHANTERVRPGPWIAYRLFSLWASVVKALGRINRFQQFQLLDYNIAIPLREGCLHANITRLLCPEKP